MLHLYFLIRNRHQPQIQPINKNSSKVNPQDNQHLSYNLSNNLLSFPLTLLQNNSTITNIYKKFNNYPYLHKYSLLYYKSNVNLIQSSRSIKYIRILFK